MCFLCFLGGNCNFKIVKKNLHFLCFCAFLLDLDDFGKSSKSKTKNIQNRAVLDGHLDTVFFYLDDLEIIQIKICIIQIKKNGHQDSRIHLGVELYPNRVSKSAIWIPRLGGTDENSWPERRTRHSWSAMTIIQCKNMRRMAQPL